MGIRLKSIAAVSLVLLLTGCAGFSSNDDLLPDPTPTLQPTQTPLPTPSTPAKPEVLKYWPNGLKVVDITDQTSRSCSFDMCVFLKVTALKTCSKITIDGTTYTAADEEVDTFSDDFPRLKKGATRVIEFGTDASYDSEDYVEMDHTTCWK